LGEDEGQSVSDLRRAGPWTGFVNGFLTGPERCALAEALAAMKD